MRRTDREVTGIGEIEKIIKLCKTCHIAMVDKGKPYVIPLSFGYEIEGNCLNLFFHSAKEGRKIEILKENNEVCFEMACEGKPVNTDTPCNSGYYFSSVIGNGKVEFIEEIEEKCKALSLVVKHQAGWQVTLKKEQAESVCVYKITTTDFTGKRKPELEKQ